MKSFLFAARETGRGGLIALRLRLHVILAVGALLFSCKYGAPSAMGASSFSPLPKQSAVAITNAIILVSPNRLNFGSIPIGEGVTNTFLVENVGRGKLVGTASVSAPFQIISGGHYALTDKELQVVTVGYTPRRARADTATVAFTGGGGAKVTVTGIAVGGRD